tara:strand:+ start:125 stop:349 length:225 start_codon:yes stop_codon:yes gene_type:complete
MNREQLLRIFKLILEQESNVLKVRGGRGYGAGHPIYKTGKVSMHLGPQGEEEKVQPEKEPVKISKVFKNKKRNK